MYLIKKDPIVKATALWDYVFWNFSYYEKLKNYILQNAPQIN